MLSMTPEIVQVIPHEDYTDYTVSVYFCDGKIVSYDVKPKLQQGIFMALNDKSFYLNHCKIMNDTLAWDLSRKDDPTNCIDIDPDYLYLLEPVNERIFA